MWKVCASLGRTFSNALEKFSIPSAIYWKFFSLLPLAAHRIIAHLYLSKVFLLMLCLIKPIFCSFVRTHSNFLFSNFLIYYCEFFAVHTHRTQGQMLRNLGPVYTIPDSYHTSCQSYPVGGTSQMREKVAMLCRKLCRLYESHAILL